MQTFESCMSSFYIIIQMIFFPIFWWRSKKSIQMLLRCFCKGFGTIFHVSCGLYVWQDILIGKHYRQSWNLLITTAVSLTALLIFTTLNHYACVKTRKVEVIFCIILSNVTVIMHFWCVVAKFLFWTNSSTWNDPGCAYQLMFIIYELAFNVYLFIFHGLLHFLAVYQLTYLLFLFS